MFRRHWLICFALGAVELAVLAVITLFQDVSMWKLRQVVGNMEQSQKRICYISPLLRILHFSNPRISVLPEGEELLLLLFLNR
jgi:hypothetical protein